MNSYRKTTAPEKRSAKKRSTARAKKKKQYVCRTCGSVSPAKGHLCTPTVLDKAYKCEFCGLVVSDARHVCKPKAAKLKYYCDF